MQIQKKLKEKHPICKFKKDCIYILFGKIKDTKKVSRAIVQQVNLYCIILQLKWANLSSFFFFKCNYDVC